MGEIAFKPEKPRTAPSIVVGQDLDQTTRLEAWRQAVSAVFDLEDVDPATFDCGMRSWNLGPMVLGEFWSTGNRFVRSKSKIAGSGPDHYIVQLLVRGKSAVTGGAPEGDWPVGSVRLLDMTRPVETRADAFENLSLILPRSALDPLLSTPADLHGIVLAPQSNGAIILSGFMRTLADRAALLTPPEAEAMSQAAAALVASSFGPSALGRDTARSAGAAVTRAMVQGFIEARLGDRGLNATPICTHFGLSRATLYRLFEPLGGVNAYVRTRRLNRAYRALRGALNSQTRVSTIASDLGFQSLASFSRDFRARFGVSPRDVRRAAAVEDVDADGGGFLRWVESL